MSNKATAQPLSIKFLTSSFLVFWLVLAAFPFMWTLWGSFKVEGDFFSLRRTGPTRCSAE